jgi:hypothetical protein
MMAADVQTAAGGEAGMGEFVAHFISRISGRMRA